MARTSTWAAPRVIVVPIWTCQCGILGTPTETGRYQTLSESSERPLGSVSGCQSLSKIKTTDLFPGFFIRPYCNAKKGGGGITAKKSMMDIHEIRNKTDTAKCQTHKAR